jgi:CRP/FNR family cyclic AMP-dependent transcriptional regulator
MTGPQLAVRHVLVTAVSSAWYTQGHRIVLAGDMMLPKTSAILAGTALFAGLSASDRSALAALMRRRRYADEEVIFRQGDPGDTLYIIATGTVKIVRSTEEGKELLLTLLGPGEVFGELSLLDGEPRSADAVAQESCEVFLLRREDLYSFLRGHPTVAEALLRVLARRLRATDDVLDEAAFLDLPTRLARLLLRLAHVHGRRERDRVVLGLRFTHAEIASMVGSSRESVTRNLKQWEREGLISYRAGLVSLLQPDALQERAYRESEAE